MKEGVAFGRTSGCTGAGLIANDGREEKIVGRIVLIIFLFIIVVVIFKVMAIFRGRGKDLMFGVDDRRGRGSFNGFFVVDFRNLGITLRFRLKLREVNDVFRLVLKERERSSEPIISDFC